MVTPPTPPAFIVNVAVISRTESLNPDLVARYFDQSSAFETASGSWAPSAPNAVPTVSFQDETQLEAAIANGTLPAGTQAVILDLEKWSLTPAAQQQDPVTYYQQGAAAAHSAGLTFIATPGTDLANVINPGTTASWQRLLAAGVIGPIGSNADAYDVQAQSLEADASTYADYVHQAVTQVGAENPNCTTLAGLSTNPNGNVQPASVLLAAAQAAQNDLWGWWINDPAKSSACPNCSGPYPQTVVDFLNGLPSLGY